MKSDPGLLEAFLEEGREHLAAIEGDVLALEKGDREPELVNRIFRAMHTLKGGAGFLGLRNIKALSHALESALSALRDGQLQETASQTLPSLLLEGVDDLRRWLDDVETSDAQPLGNLPERLTALLPRAESERTDRSSTDPVPGRGAPASLDLPLSPAGGGWRARMPAGHTHLYACALDWNAVSDRKGKAPEAILEEWSVFAAVLAGGPGEACELPTKKTKAKGKEKGKGEGSATPPGVSVILSSMLERDLLAQALDLLPEALRDLNEALHAVAQSAGGHEGWEDGERKVAASEAPLAGSTSASLTALPAAAASRADSVGSAPAGSAASSAAAEKAKRQESLRIKVEALDELMRLAGELVLVRNQQLQLGLAGEKQDGPFRAVTQRLDAVTSRLQEAIMGTRMQPIGTLFNRFTRTVRDLGGQLNKSIDIDCEGREVELDKSILEALADPLTHILRNSCDHGIESREDRRAGGKPETGRIRLKAFHEGGQVHIEIQDDGKGIDAEAVKAKALRMGLRSEADLDRLPEAEILKLIFLPGFSTAAAVSDLSGRGVGMDVVRTAVEGLGGTIDLSSQAGKGTRLRLRLPLTLAIIPSLLVKAGGQRYAMPQVHLEELVRLYDDKRFDALECAANREFYRLRETNLPMAYLGEILRHPGPFSEATRSELTEARRLQRESDRRSGSGPDSVTFAVLRSGDLRFGLVVDAVLGSEEIVVKPLHKALKGSGLYSGATVLGDGEVALILDAAGLVRHAALEADADAEAGENGGQGEAASGENGQALLSESLLVFEWGPQERFALPLRQVRRVVEIDMAVVEHVGRTEYALVENRSTAILRLDQRLQVSRPSAGARHFLILPHSDTPPFGLLCTQLIDAGEFSCRDDGEGSDSALVQKSLLLHNRLTLLLDFEAWAAVAPKAGRIDASHASPTAIPAETHDAADDEDSDEDADHHVRYSQEAA